MARRALSWLSVVFAILMVGCDHASKVVAQSKLGARVIDVVPGFLDLRYTENRDTAFSIFGGLGSETKSALLTTFGVIALFFVLAAWWRHAKSTAESIAFALIAAGAIGNVFDRARLGYVIDFIHLHHWPVFNVADAAIVVGVALLLWQRIARAKLANAPE
jgi:signal peptidase II